jgi:hypothetical protein
MLRPSIVIGALALAATAATTAQQMADALEVKRGQAELINRRIFPSSSAGASTVTGVGTLATAVTARIELRAVCGGRATHRPPHRADAAPFHLTSSNSAIPLVRSCSAPSQSGADQITLDMAALEAARVGLSAKGAVLISEASVLI